MEFKTKNILVIVVLIFVALVLFASANVTNVMR